MTALAPALVVLTPGGAALAARVKAALPAALVFAKRGRVAAADVFFDDFTAQVQAAFLHGRPIVGLCAAGALIRALAPLLADKHKEPPVVAVAEDGSRSEEHTSELQSLMRISYAVFCLKKKKQHT